MSDNNRLHSVRMIGLSLLSAGLAVVVSVAGRAGWLAEGIRPAVAIIPVLPLVALFFGIARWLGTRDELQRMIDLEAMVIQFASIGILVMSYGMLAKTGAVPNVPATTAFPDLWMAIFGFWCVGIVWVRRKYR